MFTSCAVDCGAIVPGETGAVCVRTGIKPVTAPMGGLVELDTLLDSTARLQGKSPTLFVIYLRSFVIEHFVSGAGRVAGVRATGARPRSSLVAGSPSTSEVQRALGSVKE